MAPYFHKDAKMFWAGKEPNNMPIADLFKFIDTLGKESDKNAPYSVDIIDLMPDMAIGKVVFKFHGKVYTDYHVFAKTADGWKIVTKVYHEHK